MAQTSEKLQALAIKLAHVIRDVPDFPRPGILFKDISPLLADVATWKETIDAIVEHYRNKRIEAVGGIEARGFLLGVPIAMALGVPFIMFRKPGALPGKSISAEYVKEYSTAIKRDVIEITYDAIKEGQRVLVVDGTSVVEDCKIKLFPKDC